MRTIDRRFWHGFAKLPPQTLTLRTGVESLDVSTGSKFATPITAVFVANVAINKLLSYRGKLLSPLEYLSSAVGSLSLLRD